MSTLPARLVELSERFPARVAFRRKVLGVWEETTYDDYLRRAAAIGAALARIGVGAGDRVAIMSENRPEWLFADVGVQGLGANSVGVPPAAPEDDARYLLGHTEATVAIVEDEFQLDKVLAVRSGLPELRHILVIDAPGEVLDGDAVALRSVENSSAGMSWVDGIFRLDPSSCAAIVQTAGATGPPKALRLSHATLVAAGRTLAEAVGMTDADEVLSPLPLSQITSRVLSSAAALHAGAAVHFGEAGPTFAVELREVQPTVFLAPPRVWEQLYASTRFRMQGATRLKRAAYRYGTTHSGPLAWLVLQRSLREKLGMGRARVALSTGASISEDVFTWLHGVGVAVRDLYGPAEAAGIVSIGGAVNGVELRIGDDGDLLVRSPMIADGVVGEDGWLHTGDLATLDGAGDITIMGRAADVIELSTGRQVAPAPIEAQLKASPFIRDAVLVGDGRPFVTALIGVEPVTVGEWLARDGAPAGDVADMARRPEVVELIGREVDAVDVAGFRLLPTELDEESGLLTSTFQVRRPAVIARFGELVEAMYATEAVR